MIPNDIQKCSNCGEINPLYLLNCTKCKHYLRSNVPNIDLWKTIWHLFEKPKHALTNIVIAEHKNFVSFLFFFLGLKLFITAASVQSVLNIVIPNSLYFYLNLIILLSIYISTILLFTLLFTVIVNRRVKTRFRDNLSSIVYAFTPAILALFILTPVEYGLFGKHWFISNPSPFLIKETLAYILLFVEILMFGWSIIILFIGFKLQANSTLLSLISLFFFLVVIVSEILFIPFTLL